MLSWDSSKLFRAFNVKTCHYSKVRLNKGDLNEILSLDIFPLCIELNASIGILKMVYCKTTLNLLVTLELSDNQISSLHFLKNLPNLVALRLAHNKLDADSLFDIRSLLQLEFLDLSFNLLNNIDHIQCPKLKVLNASYNVIETLDYISRCESLQDLNLAGNALMDVSRAFNLKNLQILNIEENRFIRLESIEFLSTMDILNMNFLNNPFVVDNAYFRMLYINIFCKCNIINGQIILQSDKIASIKYFRCLEPPAKISRSISSFDLMQKSRPYQRIAIILEMGVSYASKLVKDAPLLFSLMPSANKIQLCAHQFASWLDAKTLVVHDGSLDIQHESQLVTTLANDEYDYNRFRTIVIEFVIHQTSVDFFETKSHVKLGAGLQSK